MSAASSSSNDSSQLRKRGPASQTSTITGKRNTTNTNNTGSIMNDHSSGKHKQMLLRRDLAPKLGIIKGNGDDDDDDEVEYTGPKYGGLRIYGLIATLFLLAAVIVGILLWILQPIDRANGYFSP
jgi:hypothetical protein